jgi:hypothetical protein
MTDDRFTVKAKELAARFGVSPKAIGDAKRSGRLSAGVSWKVLPGERYPNYDPDAARIEWDENAHPEAQQVKLGEGTRRAKPTVNKKSSLVDIKKAQALIDLEHKTLKLDRERETLVERQAVYDSLFEFAQKVRGRLRAIPSRIVDDLLASADRVDTLRILNEAIDEALNELADADTKSLKL